MNYQTFAIDTRIDPAADPCYTEDTPMIYCRPPGFTVVSPGKRLVGERINLRFTPELQFKLDESTEYAIHMNQLMEQVAKERETRKSGE